MIKIVGFQHKQGDFDNEKGRNIAYDNIILYIICDSVKDVIGCSVSELKIAFDKCESITGFKYELLPEIINKKVSLNYIPVGKYQQLESIMILPEAAEVKK